VCQHPALVRALATDRVAELRTEIQETGSGTRHEVARPRAYDAVRRATGWMLVDVGLRLALSHSAQHPVPQAHR
jgi:hypothetical protein